MVQDFGQRSSNEFCSFTVDRIGLRFFFTMTLLIKLVESFNGIGSRAFTFSPKIDDKPKLILIGGCTGTGKSTFGMSIALDQGILKCISTDTVRAVMRSFIGPNISPALHRSSYSVARRDGNDDPILSWRETCSVLETSVEGLVDDAIKRGVSLVVEGVHVVPSNDLIRKWEDSGGVAVGCILTIRDEISHKTLLERRGIITGKGEDKKIANFDRVRAIQDQMIYLAEQVKWLMIEQKLEPDPLEIVSASLMGRHKKDEGTDSCYSSLLSEESGKKAISDIFTDINGTS